MLGTERHEARRIDNQLRGRAGRQGDPGATQFFVSLEDSLMRVFAGDTIKGLMSRLGVAEDEPIENRLITRSLENAQKKIEGFNFDSRKQVLEYDDVLNHQRKMVYARRRDILTGSFDNVAAKLDEIIAGIGAEAPTAGVDVATLTKVIEEKVAEFGREKFYSTVRQILLQSIDMFWVEHLEVMDHTRGSVNLRAYGQRDPLVEYKREGLRLFREMQIAINNQVLNLIPRISDGVAAAQTVKLKETHAEARAITATGGASGATDAEVVGNRHQRRAAKRFNK